MGPDPESYTSPSSSSGPAPVTYKNVPQPKIFLCRRTFLVFAGHPQSFQDIPQSMINGSTPQTYVYTLNFCRTILAEFARQQDI